MKHLIKARRWLIVGAPGSGKSTLALRMAEILGLPVIHLDKHYWRAGWVQPDRDEWLCQVSELSAGEAWIMDGNYSGTIDMRLPRADAVVMLDLPVWQCVWGIFRRSVLYRGAVRPDLPKGCPEHLPDAEFLWFVVSYRWRSRPTVLRKIAERGAPFHRLRSHPEVRGFVEELRWAHDEAWRTNELP